MFRLLCTAFLRMDGANWPVSINLFKVQRIPFHFISCQLNNDVECINHWTTLNKCNRKSSLRITIHQFSAVQPAAAVMVTPHRVGKAN